MTEKEITSAIVELFPGVAFWDHDLGVFVWGEFRDGEIREFRPCDDPLAIREVEMRIQGFVSQVLYPRQLVRVARDAAFFSNAVEGEWCDAYWAIVATPRQKAEALLLAHGKWKGDGLLAGGYPATGEFIVSINDGFVEYSYPWELPSDYSINEICQKLSQALGCSPSSAGTIRETRQT